MASICSETTNASTVQYEKSDPLLDEWDCISDASFDSSFCLDACEMEPFTPSSPSSSETMVNDVHDLLALLNKTNSDTPNDDTPIYNTLNSSLKSWKSFMHKNTFDSPTPQNLEHANVDYVPSTPESLSPSSPSESSVDDLQDDVLPTNSALSSSQVTPSKKAFRREQALKRESMDEILKEVSYCMYPPKNTQKSLNAKKFYVEAKTYRVRGIS